MHHRHLYLGWVFASGLVHIASQPIILQHLSDKFPQSFHCRSVIFVGLSICFYIFLVFWLIKSIILDFKLPRNSSKKMTHLISSNKNNSPAHRTIYILSTKATANGLTFLPRGVTTATTTATTIANDFIRREAKAIGYQFHRIYALPRTCSL